MLTVCLLDGKTGYNHNGSQNLDGSKRWMFQHQFGSWLAQMESIRGQFAHSILVPAGIWMLMMTTRTLMRVKASTPTTTMIMTCSRTPQQKVYYFNQQCLSEAFSWNAWCGTHRCPSSRQQVHLAQTPPWEASLCSVMIQGQNVPELACIVVVLKSS